MYKLHFKSYSGSFWFTTCNSKGKVLATSETYASEQHLYRGFESYTRTNRSQRDIFLSRIPVFEVKYSLIARPKQKRLFSEQVIGKFKDPQLLTR